MESSFFLTAFSTLTKFTSYCKNRVETVKAAVIAIKKPNYGTELKPITGKSLFLGLCYEGVNYET